MSTPALWLLIEAKRSCLRAQDDPGGTHRRVVRRDLNKTLAVRSCRWTPRLAVRKRDFGRERLLVSQDGASRSQFTRKLIAHDEGHELPGTTRLSSLIGRGARSLCILGEAFGVGFGRFEGGGHDLRRRCLCVDAEATCLPCSGVFSRSDLLPRLRPKCHLLAAPAANRLHPKSEPPAP